MSEPQMIETPMSETPISETPEPVSEEVKITNFSSNINNSLEIPNTERNTIISAINSAKTTTPQDSNAVFKEAKLAAPSSQGDLGVVNAATQAGINTTAGGKRSKKTAKKTKKTKRTRKTKKSKKSKGGSKKSKRRQ